MTTDREILIELKNAGLYRGDRWLVRGVDLAVRRGEIVTLVGPNGSGKSTTVKMALGILKPDEGSVRVGANLKVGYVPQKVTIDRTLPMTVRRLMTLTGRLTDAQIDEALEAAGIAHRAQSEAQTLSGGEFQRVLLARALARQPDILVLDEPVQGVDFSGEIALYELIRTIRDRTGCGILLISHDLHVVMASTDTVICLNGHVCCRGAPQQVLGSPEYRQLFGARAAGALAIYQHDHDHAHLPDGTEVALNSHGHGGHAHRNGCGHDHAHENVLEKQHGKAKPDA